jgi:hypothetical protein
MNAGCVIEIFIDNLNRSLCHSAYQMQLLPSSLSAKIAYSRILTILRNTTLLKYKSIWQTSWSIRIILTECCSNSRNLVSIPKLKVVSHSLSCWLPGVVHNSQWSWCWIWPDCNIWGLAEMRVSWRCGGAHRIHKHLPTVPLEMHEGDNFTGRPTEECRPARQAIKWQSSMRDNRTCWKFRIGTDSEGWVGTSEA